MILKQILYLGHWIIKMDAKKFVSLLNYAQAKSNRTKTGMLLDIPYCVLKYKISIMEYFQFDFFLINEEARKAYVGTPCLEEYLLKMNPKSERYILQNKLEFLRIYAPFVKHNHATMTDLQANNDSAKKVLNNKSGKIVLKSLFGQCGIGIEILSTRDIDSNAVVDRLKSSGNDFIEEYIIQHKDLMRLSPSAVNTVRFMTQLSKEDEVEILGARMRISINSPIDNTSQGNMIAPINLLDGKIEGPGIFFDVTKPDVYRHPITGIEIVGFQIPFWKDSLQLVCDAAVYNKKNRSIGWDVAITDNGPELIEGNHNWCKVGWQLPVRKGLKPLIEQYL